MKDSFVVNLWKEKFPEFEDAQIQVRQVSQGGKENYSLCTIFCIKEGRMIFNLVQLTGCCAYLISTGTYISESLRKKGYSYRLQEMKEILARKLGYSILLCTVRVKNKPENKCLKKSGWKKIGEVRNKRTDNLLYMYHKILD